MIEWAQYIVYLGFLTAVVGFVLNFVFAVAVWVDVDKLVHRDKQKTVLVSGFVWMVATLAGGVFVAVGYWVIHRSSIAKLDDIPSEFDLNNYLA